MNSLSGGLLAAQGSGVAVACWSLRVLDLLGDQSNTSILSWDNSDGLFHNQYLPVIPILHILELCAPCR